MVPYAKADPGRRAVEDVDLLPLFCWECRFESRPKHRCRFVANVVLSSRGHCDGLITLPEESNRVWHYKSHCSTVHFRRITSIYQPTNAHIISHKTLLKYFKTLRHVSILSDHHQGALFLAKVILRYSQFNSYL